jgi:hypothetical protein
MLLTWMRSKVPRLDIVLYSLEEGAVEVPVVTVGVGLVEVLVRLSNREDGEAIGLKIRIQLVVGRKRALIATRKSSMDGNESTWRVEHIACIW